MLFKDLVYLVESNTNYYLIRGYLVFRDPFGTGPKEVYFKEAIETGVSGEQAVLKLSLRLAEAKGFKNSYYFPNRGYSITQLPGPPGRQPPDSGPRQTEFDLK